MSLDLQSETVKSPEEKDENLVVDNTSVLFNLFIFLYANFAIKSVHL